MSNFNKNKIGRLLQDVERLIKLDTTSSTDQLNEWLKENEFGTAVLNSFSSKEQLKKKLLERRKVEQSKRLAVRRMLSTVNDVKHRQLFMRVVGVAAVILIGMFIVFFYQDKKEPGTTTIYPNLITQAEQLQPTLILEDGESILLNQTDKCVNVNDSSLFAQKPNRLQQYQPLNLQKNEPVAYNTLVVPKMCTYMIVLEDGTEVTLNSNSKLIYPVHFSTDMREVTLVGEAYFHVSTSKVPFIVRSGNSHIKVYGTQFNVNSNNQTTSTVLVEGSIGFTFKNSEELRLVPGTMAVVNELSGEQHVESVNVERYIAWTKGFFRLDEEPLTLLLQNVSDWYAIQFVNVDNAVLTEKISASISRDLPLDELIEILQKLIKKPIINKGGKQYYIE